MKNLLKISIIAAALTMLGATAALADSTEMSRQIDIGLRESGRHPAEPARNSPTIGVYAHGRGIGREQRVMREPRQELRLEQRENFHGQTTSIYRRAE
jgi:hypothetical protein